MVFRNREGTNVDPVPCLVVVSAAFLLSFSFGPGYLLAFGVSLPVALAVSAVVFVGLSATAYHQMVWTSRPDLQGEVPAASRLRRLFYLMVLVALVLLLLSFPFLADTPPEFGSGDMVWF